MYVRDLLKFDFFPLRRSEGRRPFATRLKGTRMANSSDETPMLKALWMGDGKTIVGIGDSRIVTMNYETMALCRLLPQLIFFILSLRIIFCLVDFQFFFLLKVLPHTATKRMQKPIANNLPCHTH